MQRSPSIVINRVPDEEAQQVALGNDVNINTPKMPQLYLELIENKQKIRQDLIDKPFQPSDDIPSSSFNNDDDDHIPHRTNSPSLTPEDSPPENNYTKRKNNSPSSSSRDSSLTNVTTDDEQDDGAEDALVSAHLKKLLEMKKDSISEGFERSKAIKRKRPPSDAVSSSTDSVSVTSKESSSVNGEGNIKSSSRIPSSNNRDDNDDKKSIASTNNTDDQSTTSTTIKSDSDSDSESHKSESSSRSNASSTQSSSSTEPPRKHKHGKHKHKHHRHEEIESELNKYGNNNHQHRHPSTSGVAAPSLQELEAKGLYKRDQNEYRDIGRFGTTANGMTDLEEENAKRQLLFKFDLLRKRTAASGSTQIPEFTLHSDYKQMEMAYQNTLRNISVDSAVSNYRMYLTGSFYVVELVFGNWLKLDMQGFAHSQMMAMSSYDSLLIELGEKSYVPTGSRWPVEVRLLGMVITQAIIFLLTKMMMKNGGADLMGMMGGGGRQSQQDAPPMRRRRMRPPDITTNDLDDLQ